MTTNVGLQPQTRLHTTQNIPKVSLEGLAVTFGQMTARPVQVLTDINLQVPFGQFLSIVGPSGCGKSTLLRVLSGIVQPSAGKAEVDGKRVMGAPPDVGFMFQRDTLLPWATVAENIKVGAELSSRFLSNPTKTELNQRIRDLIGFLGLPGFEHHRPHQLSGGMRQRVALGRLLAYDPDLYLMDEPFGALDSQTKTVMGRELLRIWMTYRRSVIFITHDIEEAVTLSDRVVVLSNRPGRVKFDLTIDLPRPRDPIALRRDPYFRELCDQIWGHLDVSVHQS